MSQLITERRKELEKALRILDQEENQILEERLKKKNEAWAVICAQYEWEVKPRKYISYSEGQDGVQISRRVKEDLYTSFVKEWGVLALTDNRWDTMFYYRTDENIITECGGGILLLNTPKLCSDEEWTAILNGNIPEKFINYNKILTTGRR